MNIMEVQTHSGDTTSVVAVASIADVPPGKYKNFELELDGFRQHGVLINYHGDFHAYLNVCPHAGIPLDTVDKGIFNADGSYLICRKHWALFQPETGICVSGPCPIAPLSKLVVHVENEMIYVSPKN
ncbi:Rieske (2Fe-2S) domain protein [Chloroherpeton thalassium ATCC 35110]|uniref:Rieske (2Fe-2S) domain protein n=2 Tax=Chloroherpeton thalassium TaxID=100716 RepID=B3QXT0_CHLT3|nr:Rieske (2Fe-2S) domain protein [Chloroherpeton thalassium ATCC 35110]